jgi:uncharacterized protein YbcI
MGKRAKEHNKKIANRNQRLKAEKRNYEKNREKIMMQLIRQMEDENAKKQQAEKVNDVTDLEAVEFVENVNDSKDNKAWVDQLPKE